MTDWRDTVDDQPDWKDGGRIELRYADGRQVVGRLTFDAFFTGEDEVPVPEVTQDDGTKLSFYDAEQWRPFPKTADKDGS